MNSRGYDLISKYRRELMGFAMIWVIFFHSTISIEEFKYLHSLKTLGYAGVDIFLLVSGLGLYFSYKKDSNIISFYKRRFVRIIPTYITIVTLFSIIFLLLNKIDFLDLIMNITTLSFWFNTTRRFDWYIPSLIILYLIAPIYINLFNRFKYKTIIIAISLSLGLSFCITNTSLSYLLIFTVRFPIFFIGVLIGYLIDQKKKINYISYGIYTIMFLIGIILMGLFLTKYSNYLWTLGLWWYPFIFITVPLSLFVVCMLDIINKKYKRKFGILTFLGGYSLEIYLFHERILLLASYLFSNIIFDKYNIIFNILCLIVTSILVLIFNRIMKIFIIEKEMKD